MELIVLFVLALVAGTATEALVLVLELAFVLVQVIGELIGFVVRRRRRGADNPETRPKTEADTRSSRQIRRAPAKWLRMLGMGLIVVTGGAIVLFETVLFEPIIRASTGKLDESGIELRFDEAHGSLIAGRVELLGVRARSVDHDRAEFDLQAGRALVDIAPASVFSDEFVVEAVEFETVRGQFERTATLPSGAADGQSGPSLRGFRVDSLVLADIELQLRQSTLPGRAVEVPFRVERYEASRVHSPSLLYDLLFRGTGRGTVAGGSFEVELDESQDAHVRRIQLSDIPIDTVAGLGGDRPRWIRGGSLDASIEHAVDGPDHDEFDLDYAVVIEGARFEAPGDAGPMAQRLAAVVQAWMARHGGKIELEFRLRMMRDDVRFATSLQSMDLIAELGRAILDELRERKRGERGAGARQRIRERRGAHPE